jgi:hypothetical protein
LVDAQIDAFENPNRTVVGDDPVQSKHSWIVDC